MHYLPNEEARIDAVWALNARRLRLQLQVPLPPRKAMNEEEYKVVTRAWEKVTAYVKHIRRPNVSEQVVIDETTRRTFVCRVPGYCWIFTVQAVAEG